jgi:hypothetical protein
MNLRIQFLAVLALVLAVSASPARANRVDRGASGNGVLNADCNANIQTDPACFQFTVTGAGTAQFESFSEALDGTAVVDNNFSLFMVSTASPVTLQLANAGVAYGSFMCGLDGDFGAIDSNMLSNVQNFCNPETNPADFLDPNPDSPNGSNQVTFGFTNATGNLPSEWVFYTDFGQGSIVPGGTTTMPEPASILLLGTGLLGLCANKLRRRSKVAAAA